jgi:hypothetical protein
MVAGLGPNVFFLRRCLYDWFVYQSAKFTAHAFVEQDTQPATGPLVGLPSFHPFHKDGSPLSSPLTTKVATTRGTSHLWLSCSSYIIAHLAFIQASSRLRTLGNVSRASRSNDSHVDSSRPQSAAASCAASPRISLIWRNSSPSVWGRGSGL